MITKLQKGFTLIELMITVAIVGILASVAFPAYQSYTTRAQISASLLMVEGAKTFFIDHYTQKGSFPTSNADAGYPGATGKYLQKVDMINDHITATIGNEANADILGETVSLIGTVNANTSNITWRCTSSMKGTAKEKYLPSSCRDAQ